MIKGVFFDLGGTLYNYGDPKSMLGETVTRLVERLGLEHDEADLMQLYAQANAEVAKEFSQKPFFLMRDWFRTLFARFLALIEAAHHAHHVDWFHQFQHDALLATMTLRPDCHDTLQRLKDMGLYLSIVSNIDDDMFEPLFQRGQFDRWMDHWTTSEGAQSCKPDQRFFQIVLEKSGLKPEEVVFVGDSIEQDILGAHLAGMGTVLIADSEAGAPGQVGRTNLPEPDYRIRALSELPDLVRTFSRRSA